MSSKELTEGWTERKWKADVLVFSRPLGQHQPQFRDLFHLSYYCCFLSGFPVTNNLSPHPFGLDPVEVGPAIANFEVSWYHTYPSSHPAGSYSIYFGNLLSQLHEFRSCAAARSVAI